MHRILGQTRALDALRRAIASGRLHHAWIFSGPKGVGKFTTAVELARILLDPHAGPNLAGEIEADPDCPVSRLIDAGTHPDLHVIRKELAKHSADRSIHERKLRNIPVDVIREHIIGGEVGDTFIEAPAYRTAVQGHGKVFIVDEAELIDPVGQNALLKTLEEPPRQTYLFLVTNRPDRLLPTIHSRCQHVRFGPLDDAAMTTWFDRADLEIDGGERAWITAFADGAPGVALLAAEYGFHRWHVTLKPMLDELARGDFPAAMGDTMAALVEEYAVAWVKAHENASKDAANKAGVGHLLSLLARHARTGLAAALEAGADPEGWLRAIDLIRDAEGMIARNVNQKMVLENLAVQWAAVPA